MLSRLEKRLTPWLVKASEVEQAFQQLVILFKGDVLAVAALDTVSTLARDPLAARFRETADLVRGGLPLARALTRVMPWLETLFIGLIGVGEANGSLAEMFAYASSIMRQRLQLRSRIIRAMTYPAIVVLMGMGVGYYVSVIAIPKIASVMGDPEKLPPITKSLLTMSEWVKTEGYWLLVIPMGLFALFFLLRLIPRVAVVLDRFSLALPLFGKVGRYAANALLNHTLSVLVRSGVSLVDALALVNATLTNRWYKRELSRVRQEVMEGKMFSDALADSGLGKICPLTTALVRVGENSGNLDEGLSYVGGYYAEQLDKRLELMGSLVEPVLIVFIGGMVAYVYIAFFMGMAAMNAAAF